MSIVSFIESVDKDRDYLQSKVSELRKIEGISVEFYDGKSILPFLSKNPWIRIYGVEDFLEEDDGPEKKYWNFSPAGIQKLNDFLSNFFEVYQKSFLFSFIWAGDEIGATVKNVNLTQMLTIIKSNKLEEVTYKVEVDPC